METMEQNTQLRQEVSDLTTQQQQQVRELFMLVRVSLPCFAPGLYELIFNE